MVFIRPASRLVPSNRSLSTTYFLVSTLNRHGTNVLDFAYHPSAVRQCVSRVSSYHRVWEPLMNLARTIASMILTSGFLVLSSAAAAQNSVDNRPAASSAAQDPSVARLEKDIPELMKQGTVPGLFDCPRSGRKDVLVTQLRGEGDEDARASNRRHDF